MMRRSTRRAVSACAVLFVAFLSGCGEEHSPDDTNPDPGAVSLDVVFDSGPPIQVAMAPKGGGVLVGGVVEAAVTTGTCSVDSCERSNQPSLSGSYGISIGFITDSAGTDLLHVLTCSTDIEPCPPVDLSVELFQAGGDYAPIAVIPLKNYGLMGSNPVVNGTIRGEGSPVVTVADEVSMSSMVFVVDTDEGTFTDNDASGGIVAVSPAPDGSVVMATKKVDVSVTVGGGPVAPVPAQPLPSLTVPEGVSGSSGSGGSSLEPGGTEGPPTAEIEILRLDTTNDLGVVRTISEASPSTQFLATPDGLNLIATGDTMATDAVTGKEVSSLAERPATEASTITAQFCAGSVPGALLVDTTQVLPNPQSTTLSFSVPAGEMLSTATFEQTGLVSPNAACAVGDRVFAVVARAPTNPSDTPNQEERSGAVELMVL